LTAIWTDTKSKLHL